MPSEPTTTPLSGEAPLQDARFCLGAPRAQEVETGSGMHARMPRSLPDPQPAEGTTEKPMTLVDSVARKFIVKSHKAEAFVSQDVVGE